MAAEPIATPSSSFLVFGGQYNNTVNGGAPLFNNTNVTNRVKNTIQEWQSWYQNPNGNIGEYKKGSLRISDSNFGFVNGKIAGGWVDTTTQAETRTSKNGFLGDLSISITPPMAPSTGTQVVLAAADFTAISQSRGAIDRENVESWWDDIEGMFTLGGPSYSPSGWKIDQTFHNSFRGKNAYGGGGPNANPNYAVYFLQNGYLGNSTTRSNGRMVMYQIDENKFTELVRTIPLPISKSIMEMITSDMDATGSVSLITWGGLPVLQPKNIYGQFAMFLPDNGSNFSIKSVGQPAAPPSDRRLKRNINKVGISEKGYNIYTFEYKDVEKHGKGLYQGVMAQEVPHAQVKIGDYYHVNYSKLDVEFKKLENEM